jgi:hypothetical protein
LESAKWSTANEQSLLLSGWQREKQLFRSKVQKIGRKGTPKSHFFTRNFSNRKIKKNNFINILLAELAHTFDLLDMDKDGRLSRGEIAALLRTGKVEPTRKELDFIFSEMDHESEAKWKWKRN